MPTPMQPSDIPLMSDEVDETDIEFDQAVPMHHQDSLHHQHATQNREHGKLLLRKLSQTRERERGKECEQERERLHQLQSINNLLLDLPTPPSPSHLPNFSQDISSSSQSGKNVSIDGNGAISDMFRLNLPRGSLMGNQSTVGSSSYRNLQYSDYEQMQGSSSQQHEPDDNGIRVGGSVGVNIIGAS